MQILVKLFGPEAQVAQTTELALDLSGDNPTCADLRREIARVEPRLAGALPHCRFAVNHNFAGEDQTLNSGDEVALIGMVAGG